MTVNPSQRLAATVAGQPSPAAPIVTAAWSALRAALAASPRKWHDAVDLADRAAALIDCRPSLCDELLLAAVETGHLSTRTRNGSQQVRVAQSKEDLQ